MNSSTPHDPFDELIALALHHELTPEERTQFDLRLQTDPAAQAAYQKAQAMHDLLEKTHKEAQPDPNFEQRMVSGVRRKIRTEQDRETKWGSLLRLWLMLKAAPEHIRIYEVVGVLFVIALLSGVALGPITNGIKKAKQSSMMQEAHSMALQDYQDQADAGIANPVMKDLHQFLPQIRAERLAKNDQEGARDALALMDADASAKRLLERTSNGMVPSTSPTQIAGYATRAPSGTLSTGNTVVGGPATPNPATAPPPPKTAFFHEAKPDELAVAEQQKAQQNAKAAAQRIPPAQGSFADDDYKEPSTATTPQGGTIRGAGFDAPTATTTNTAPAEIDSRKLIRNATLDLEVKSFQSSLDQITALTKSAGGYVDTSNSEKGGNGKLHGSVVVKVLPQNLDAFLLKLRDVGQVQNQSVSTDDVTKDYIDTQARLANSQKMETQLQDLLKRENGKVSDLLAVERELGRVRGEIEQMQGQLKLYDFQVQYATVTMTMSEKDLNQAAAYLLKEQDDFSLFATDVEATFQKARAAADDFKAQVLTANLNHNSGSDVSAELEVMVAPDQIEPFLAQVRGLGRVANFTRQTQRVAKDGGDSAQPADQTATEKDKVQVHLAIRSDDETRKQVALTVVTKAVDTALDQAKAAALANAGVEILASSLNKTPQGQSTAQLSVRVPGQDYATLIAAFNALGRTASLSIQRNDNSGPGSSGDDAPVIVSLALTDDDAPLQQTQMSVAAKDVDQQSQEIKKSAATAGVEVKASSFERQPDGTELASMTFRLPMAKYPAFLERVKALGKVESLTVHRDDRPDQTRADDTAPAEIALQLHSQRDLMPDDTGLFATLGNTFGAGANTLFATLKFIGVIVAFLVPWVLAIGLLAWIGRRIYLWRKK